MRDQHTRRLRDSALGERQQMWQKVLKTIFEAKNPHVQVAMEARVPGVHKSPDWFIWGNGCCQTESSQMELDLEQGLQE